MEEDVWVELDWDAGEVLWAEFAERFQFRSGVDPSDWPAVVEPVPSVVWDLSPIFTGEYSGGFAAGCQDVAALVLGTLQDCTEWYETVVFHDWVHPSCLFRPHKVDGPTEVPGWDVGGLFPNGDYTIFVGRDHAFGILGHPWEHSLCVFGERAVAAFTARNHNVLTTVLRRDGQPVANSTLEHNAPDTGSDNHAGQGPRPVVAINDRGLWLGVDQVGTWLVWSDTRSPVTAADRLVWLLPLLERAPGDVIRTFDVELVDTPLPALVRYALTCWSDYWRGLALGWLESTWPAGSVLDVLDELKDDRTVGQPLRHRALRIWLAARPR